MYHGWKYDATGQCVEQPFEDTVNPGARFKERVKIAGYPVRALSGLLFAYLGPLPAPELPHWGPLTWDECVRDIALAETSMQLAADARELIDPIHVEWLHTYFGRWAQQQERGS